MGADIDFDNDGNLFVSMGDNTAADTPGSNGYAPNNNAPGMSPGLDARRGAGSTNDLRGAILRIKVKDAIPAGTEPAAGATYDIPAGNLFDSLNDPVAYPADKVREEIYILGVRNPFRMSYDPVAKALSWADYGPDASGPSAERGPMGFVEWQVTDKPIAAGWPYCHGPNDGGAYNEWDFTTGTAGDFFDCAAPVNNSTWNTGVKNLPPTTQPQIWYGDRPGDQPAEFDGLVTKMHNFLPNDALYEQAAPNWSGIIDMEFGPNGSLYVLEYGKGFFRQNPEAGLYRIDYSADGLKTPRAEITTDVIAGRNAPLEVNFDASKSKNQGRTDITYEWDFDSDGTIDATGVKAAYTYTATGQYNAVLYATDVDGRVGRAVQEITVGNTAPELAINIADGSVFEWGDPVDFKVTVTDAEDGNAPDCSRMSWTFGLGHDEHAHPLVTGKSCEFTIVTPEDAVNHGEGSKIFGTLVVKYTDLPQGAVPSVTGEAVLTLKPELQEAEWLDAGTRITEVLDETASAGRYVGDFDAGDYLEFGPIALTHAPTGETIDRVDVRARGNGTVSLKWKETGEVFATAEIDSKTAWQTVSAKIANAPQGSGTIVVTSSGPVDLDSFEYIVSSQAPMVCDDNAKISANDEFSGDQLNTCRWNVVSPDPALGTVADGSFQVTTTNADFNGSVNETVPNILQSKIVSGTEWTVETKFNTKFSSQWHQAGIMVYANPDNYVKIDPIFAGDAPNASKPLRLELRSEVTGSSSNQRRRTSQT